MRGPQHLSAEKCLERMFLPNLLFEKEETAVKRQEEIKFDQATLGFETEIELGWMTFEGPGGTAKHELGTFLVVQ